MKRLAVITTHPIQYYAPMFQLLAGSGEVTLKVFYTWGEDSIKKYDPDFGKVVEWDIPLLNGYDFEFFQNTAKNPGSHHFKGIVTPNAVAAINQFNPDAILVFGWAWQSHLSLIRHYAGKKPVWFRGDSTLMDEQQGVKSILRTAFLRWLYRHVDIAFYVGTRNKAYFEKFGLRNERLVWAPHAIDNNRFGANYSLKAAALRQDLQIPPSATIVLFAGKLEPKKDPLALLNAFGRHKQENQFLVFAGSGVLEGELKKQVVEVGLTNHVRFLPFQNQTDMPALYQSCDLFCLPSVGPGETWGLAVNEAMASGRAVMVSDRAGCAVDLVKPGENGKVFCGGDADSLGATLSALTASRNQLQEMGEASRRIIENWSFERQAAAILTELTKLP